MNNTRNEKLLGTVGARIRELREAKGMSMDDLADECEVEKKQIYLIEKGKNNVTVSTLALLAKGLGVTLGELMKGL